MIELYQIHDDLLEGLALMRTTCEDIADQFEERLVHAYLDLISPSVSKINDEERVETYRTLFVEIRENLRRWYALNNSCTL